MTLTGLTTTVVIQIQMVKTQIQFGAIPLMVQDLTNVNLVCIANGTLDLN